MTFLGKALVEGILDKIRILEVRYNTNIKDNRRIAKNQKGRPSED